MGWRGSTHDDVIVAALKRDGPLTIAELVDRIDQGEWERAYKTMHPDWRAPSLFYGSVYSRLQALMGELRVKSEGTRRTQPSAGRRGAGLWRVLTRAEVRAWQDRTRRELAPTAEERDRIAVLEQETGFTIRTATWSEGRRPTDIYRLLIVDTPRGPIELFPDTWEEGLEEVFG